MKNIRERTPVSSGIVSDYEADHRANRTIAAVIRDVALYTVARVLLVTALTAVIYLIARAVGLTEFPLVVAVLFAIVIGLPLGIWLLGPLRRRATASLAVVDERRRAERDRLQARLRGESET